VLVSGLYIAPGEELRLDVDGRYPQMTASGTLKTSMSSVVNWVARVTANGPQRWAGTIFYKEGSKELLPHTRIEISVTPQADVHVAKVSFEGANPIRTSTLTQHSPSFRQVEFEFDMVEGVQADLIVRTCDHPNRPGTLKCETLHIEDVFERAGFAVTTSGPGAKVPIAGAGPDAKWSDQELHDAMQIYWSRAADKPQWALWTVFAPLYQPTNPEEDPAATGGMSFDKIGPNFRQGVAVFTNSFVFNPPANDAHKDAWRRRGLFWCACHEMGHAFNLAHSSEKSGGTPWVAMQDAPEARSFMNYPCSVSGGETAFFKNFFYRFSDDELLFMRHAPESFVQMGNAVWFDNHGFRFANTAERPAFHLRLRVNRERPVYEFLEPITLELKLTNALPDPQLVGADILRPSDKLTVIIKRQGTPARKFTPYVRECRERRLIVLRPEESLYEALYLSSGLNGWDIAEPGNYEVRACLQLDGEDIVSPPLRIRVQPPMEREEEFLAQDFVSDEVGRTIAFDGSRVFDDANNTLREIKERLPHRMVARHAALALGASAGRAFKRLVADPNSQHMSVRVEKGDMEFASEMLSFALDEEPSRICDSLGHIDYRRYVESFAQALGEEGRYRDAAKHQNDLAHMLSNRNIRDRRVLPSVIDEIASKTAAYVANTKKPSRKKR